MTFSIEIVKEGFISKRTHFPEEPHSLLYWPADEGIEKLVKDF
jgi:hypothetical protein